MKVFFDHEISFWSYGKPSWENSSCEFYLVIVQDISHDSLANHSELFIHSNLPTS